MTFDDLKAALRPWMRYETWHAPHPLDQHRFHRALDDAFARAGGSISHDDFAAAMSAIAQELYPRLHADFRDELIDDFAQRAETIGQYWKDLVAAA